MGCKVLAVELLDGWIVGMLIGKNVGLDVDSFAIGDGFGGDEIVHRPHATTHSDAMLSSSQYLLILAVFSPSHSQSASSPAIFSKVKSVLSAQLVGDTVGELVG